MSSRLTYALRFFFFLLHLQLHKLPKYKICIITLPKKCLPSLQQLTILSLINCWYLNMTCCLVSTEALDHDLKAALAASTAACISSCVLFGTLVTTYEKIQLHYYSIFNIFHPFIQNIRE